MTTKSDNAYHKVRNAIFRGDFLPGQFLTQAEIVEKLGMSVGPLRDAMKRLAWEELVDVIPQRGLQIVLPNLKDIKEAFQLRIFFEKEAVRTFTQNPKPALLRKLETATHKLVSKPNNIVPPNDVLSHALDLEYSLHMTFINEMKNDQIKKYFRIIFDKIRLTWIAASYTQEIIQPVMDEHMDVIRAAKRENPDRAAKAIEVHLNNSLKRIMGL
jgi:DNA-binding GntR family transcriptional regulator